MNRTFSRIVLASFCVGVALAGNKPLASQTTSGNLGVFDGQSDIGSIHPAGTLTYDSTHDTYTLTAAGENIWSTVDAFHYAWKKMSGDVSLTADISFANSSGTPNPHRKAVLMFRQTLDADSAYADAAQHGVGLTALQYRVTPGDTTQDIELDIDAPKRVRLEKHGNTITMFLSLRGEPLHQVGASITMPLDGQFYAGIGLCAHDSKVVEKATLSNVQLQPLRAATTAAAQTLYSSLKTIAIDNSARVATVVYSKAANLQAPNWSKDGSSVVFSEDGGVWKIAAKGGAPEAINTAPASHCSGSHGFSPDGTLLAISCTTPDKPGSRVYVVPAQGGTPRLITENPGSYWHTWSPDGKTIVFTRPNKGGGGNIFAIPAGGGSETALTTGPGTSDDPDYSPDGQYIYFNSDRNGSMQIWRMRPDGSGPEQVTSDDYANWTPHLSPDGKSMLILSYDKAETGHPANKDVALRIMSLAERKSRVLVRITGGSGTDNVPNWAPDSKHFAFVSYQMLPSENK